MRSVVRANPIHRGFDADRRPGHPGLPRSGQRVRVPGGPDLPSARPRRRAEPRAAEDAIRAAGSDGARPGHRRRHQPRASETVHGDRHPEPFRFLRHLSAPGLAARSVPDPDLARASGAGDRIADSADARARGPGAVADHGVPGGRNLRPPEARRGGGNGGERRRIRRPPGQRHSSPSGNRTRRIDPGGAGALVAVAKTHALWEARSFVTPGDLKSALVPTFSHRILVRSPVQGAQSRDEAANLLGEIARKVPVPR